MGASLGKRTPLRTLKPRVLEVGNRLGAAPLLSQSRTYRIRGRKLQAIRAAHFRRNPLCVACLDRGVVRVAVELDHIVALTNGGTDSLDPFENRAGLCADCHEVKTLSDLGLKSRKGAVPRWRLAERASEIQRKQVEFNELRFPSDLRASRIPCVMVCGPPNGGKHPYVRENAGPRDVVIDLDAITRELTGAEVWDSGAEWLSRTLAERNRRLRELATDTEHDRAWFLINAPDPRERALWAQRLGATVVLLAPPLAECLRRIKAEPYRTGYTERILQAAHDWWAMNGEPEGGVG
jgi:predicted kinase